jgi:hypothetical protein
MVIYNLERPQIVNDVKLMGARRPAFRRIGEHAYTCIGIASFGSVIEYKIKVTLVYYDDQLIAIQHPETGFWLATNHTGQSIIPRGWIESPYKNNGVQREMTMAKERHRHNKCESDI